MKVAVVTLFAVMAVASISNADGFYCATPDGNLAVKIFDNVQPELGTRSAARMVISNPIAGPGARTMAVFSSEQGTLSNGAQGGQFLSYLGNVDLRFNNIHKDRTILNETVANLATITLDIDFNYQKSSLSDGDAVRGALDLSTRDGRDVTTTLSCRRYLKTNI